MCLENVLMTANYQFLLENFMQIWNMKEKIFYFNQNWVLSFLEDFMCIIIVTYVHNKVLYLYIVSWFYFLSNE